MESLFFILRLKAWQIFLIILLPLFFNYGGFIYALWLLILGAILHDISPDNLKLPFYFFIINFTIPFLNIIILSIYVPQSALNQWNDIPPILIPLHLYVMFCFFYVYYFISKSMVQYETKKKSGHDKMSGIFIALVFFPIGIWWLQKRLNKIYLKLKME